MAGQRNEPSAVMKWFKRSAIALGIVILLLATLPFLISLDDYVPTIEREASARLKQPVTVEGVRLFLFPMPHVTVSGIAVGKPADIRAASVKVTPDLWSLLGAVKVIRDIEVEDLVLTQAAIEKLPPSTKSGGQPAAVRLGSVRVKNATVLIGKSKIGPLDANVNLNAAGEPQEIAAGMRDGTLQIKIRPEGDKFLIDGIGKAWKLPVGPPVILDEFKLKATATLDHATVSEIDARLYGGRVNGSATLRWQKSMQLNGRFNVQQVELKNLLPLLSPGNRVSGKLSAKPVISAKAASAAQLGNALRIETPFNVQNGVLYGVDIQKAAGNLLSKEPTGGETRFDELSGQMLMERAALRFTQLKVASGALAASGNVTISPNKELSGRVSAEVKAGSIASASVPLNVSGTVQSPLLLPTGGTMAGAAVGTAILGPGVGTSVGAKVGEWTENLFGRKEQKR
jgi:uncharacterized protein involved in outer membrane biogenesis